MVLLLHSGIAEHSNVHDRLSGGTALTDHWCSVSEFESQSFGWSKQRDRLDKRFG
jgi:hypothetical protein